MAMMWHKMKKRGFTLVELLVVIAIIGILIAIVLPAISDAMFRGQLTRTAANIKNVYNAMVAKESEAIYRDLSNTMWPGSNMTAVAYFQQLFTGDDKIMSTTPKILAAKGVADASQWSGLTASNLAFRVVAGVDDNDFPESAPFIFSKNLNIADLSVDVTGGNAAGETIPLGSAPFGERGMVILTKGGSTFAPFKNDLKVKYFTNLWVNTPVSGTGTLNNAVLNME